MRNRRFTVVENAGYIGEQDITSFPDWREADAYIRANYDEDERDSDCNPKSLHIDIRQDWEDDDGEHSEYVY